MSAFDLSVTVRTRRLQDIADAINAGSGPGVLLLYSDPRPAPGDPATGATLQCTVALARPCATSAAGVLTFAGGPSGLRVAADPITWARLTDSGGVWVADGSVSAAGGGGAFRLDTVTGYVGATISLSASYIRE